MNRWNSQINSHFSGCPVIATAYDPYRERQVTLHALPGQFDIVGITDGTDAWIAPSNIHPFSVNIPKLLETFKKGEHLHPRVKVIVGVSPQPTTTTRTRITVTGRIINEDEEAQTQLNKALDQQQTLRRRVHVHP